MHLWPDGEILRYDGPSEVDLFGHYARAGIDAKSFARSELDEVRLILDWQDLKTYYTRFARHAQDGRALGQSEAIWVAIRSEETWKLKLRIGAARVR